MSTTVGACVPPGTPTAPQEKGVPAVTYDFQILPGSLKPMQSSSGRWSQRRARSLARKWCTEICQLRGGESARSSYEQVRQRLAERLLVNSSRSECKKQGIPYYRDEKFHDPVIGPNMHQLNACFIRPTTQQNDPFHGISRLSYALHCNPYGLTCDLFISHAWAEGVFELTGTVLDNWPEDCEAAYICALANPQNLPNFLRALIQNPLSSPFFQVLLRQPKQMLMVANANVPIHSRLWCVFEAHCARHLAVHTAVVGDPTHFATNAGASKSAKRAIREHASFFSVEVPEGQGKPDKQAKGNLQPGKPAVKVAFRRSPELGGYNPPAEAALVFGGVSLDHLILGNGIGQWITCKAKGVLGGGFVPAGETPTQELTVELRAYLQQI
eukprot:s3894_g3.t2